MQLLHQQLQKIKKVKWTSSNEKVATVSDTGAATVDTNGIVTACY